MQFYPEVRESGAVSEFWHAEKVVSLLPDDLLSPMWRGGTGQKHFYVYELALLNSGDVIVPLRWIIRHGVVTADAHPVSLDKMVCLFNFQSTVSDSWCPYRQGSGLFVVIYA